MVAMNYTSDGVDHINQIWFTHYSTTGGIFVELLCKGNVSISEQGVVQNTY